MADTLTYDLRAGVLRGFAGGRLINAPVDPSSARVTVWQKTQELRSGRHAHGRHFDANGGYVLTGVQHGASTGDRRRRIILAGTAAAADFDYPGAYAQRFDGVTEASSSRHSGGMLVVMGDGSVRSGDGDPDRPVILGQPPSAAPWFDPNFQGGIFVASAGVMIHPWPPRFTSRPTITVLASWAELFEALRQTRQVSIVVEL